MSTEPINADLVICRLAQSASPGGEGDAPLRGAALGDVQGKDARAAGMTSVVRHTLRATAQNHGPSAAMEVVNRIVLEEQERATRASPARCWRGRWQWRAG